MRASSQAALEAASERWEASLRETGERGRELGIELFETADILASSGSLRRALADPARPGEAKAQLVTALFGGKIAAEAVDLLAGMVRSRWSADEDLGHAVEDLGLLSVLASAQSGGRLLEVEEQLFRVERLLAGNRELRTTMWNTEIDPGRRADLLDSLLTDRAHLETRTIVRRLVSVPRGGSLSGALRRVGEIAAARRQRLVASVTAASPLTQAQEARLAQILTRAYGSEIHVNVGIDPQVLGGLRIQVGAEVIDGTMLTRLQDARRRFAG